MSEFVEIPVMAEVERLDAELDRIRWYLGKLGELAGGGRAGVIAEALKTGDASAGALAPVVDVAHLDSLPPNRWTEDEIGVIGW